MPDAFSPTRKQPESLRLRKFAASLTVNDLAASLRFYTELLGYTVAARHERDGKLVAVSLVAGDCDLVIGQDDGAKGVNRVKGVGIRFWMTTAQDLDALAARVKAAGISLDHEVMEMPWGVRAFAFTDPDGFKFSVAEPRAG